ncbi:EVE domain-containing protein [Dehalogenimonas sp. 4OHTPN]|uniref:EVE domain-containing protein n=1 Tax=Dehalogenimonas sp. 4OHTPN TaxID=3166643 RepID=A0AAU8G7R9_9CHLR
MAHWILQMNPNHFSLDKEYPLQLGHDDWWCLSRSHKIAVGDEAFIWRAIDYRDKKTGAKPRGIYAKARILSAPPHSREMARRIEQAKKFDHYRWSDLHERTVQESKPHEILISYTELWETNPLTCEEIKSAGLGDLHIITYPNQEICGLSELAAAKILDLLQRK